MRIRTILWVLTVAWALVIFSFSAQPAEDSSKLSKSVTRQVIQNLPGIRSLDAVKQKEAVDEMNSFARKLAHFLIYLVFGILLFLLWKSYPVTILWAFCGSIMVSAVYALTDEIHQIYVPGRKFLLLDIGIDTLGATCGMLLYWFFSRVLKKSSQP